MGGFAGQADLEGLEEVDEDAGDLAVVINRG